MTTSFGAERARPTRRRLLRGGLSLGIGAAGAGALPGLASLASASTGTGTGYKALVCVYLAGGLDNFDTVIPLDEGEYAAWAEPRARLLTAYEAAGDDSRRRENLLDIGTQRDGRRFGMPRQLAPLHALFGAGRASVVANVGPLLGPSDRPRLDSGQVAAPPHLMSHIDQKKFWHTSSVERAATGWGGRMVEAAREASPFAAISLANSTAFLSGGGVAPLVVAPRGVRPLPHTGDWAFGSRAVPDLLEAHYGASAAGLDNYLASDLQAQRRQTVEAFGRLGEVLTGDTTGDEVAQPGNALSEQLAMVAKLIGQRQALGVTRQVFFVEQQGYDTHQNQAKALPALQAELAEALAAFYRHTVRQGVAQDVTTFTASDFGRTLSVNSSGTDHGWGGHQFALGGAVRGGRIIGKVPVAGFGHDHDYDARGRLIPTLSTEQYAASLGATIGLGEAELREALPSMDRFARPPNLTSELT